MDIFFFLTKKILDILKILKSVNQLNYKTLNIVITILDFIINFTEQRIDQFAREIKILRTKILKGKVIVTATINICKATIFALKCQ